MYESSYTDMARSQRKRLVYLLDDFSRMASAEIIRSNLAHIRNEDNSIIIDKLLNTPDDLLSSSCKEEANKLKASL